MATVELDRFRSDRAAAWAELAMLADRNPRRLTAGDVLRLSTLHRMAITDLAFTRRRWPGESVIPALEALVTKSHLAIYGPVTPPSEPVRSWLVTGYWREVAGGLRYTLAAGVVLVGAAVAAAAWVAADPTTGGRLVPVAVRRAIVVGEWRMPIGALPALIGFAAGAGGVVGAGVVLAWVGAMMGAAIMLAVQAGYGSTAGAGLAVCTPALVALALMTGTGVEAGMSLFRPRNGGWRAAFGRAAAVVLTSIPLFGVGAALVELSPTPPDAAAVALAGAVTGGWCVAVAMRGRAA